MSDLRSSHWSVTINNPTPADYEQMEIARQKRWQVAGQLEKGEEGTEHLQLYVHTPQVRFAAVKKQFPRAHIEAARNPAALKQYVQKEETCLLKLNDTQAEKYPSHALWWQLFLRVIQRRNWLHLDGDSWWKDAYDELHYPRNDPDDPHTQKQQEEFAMKVFHYVVHQLIEEGYHVDHFVSPPNMNLWKRYHFAILRRSQQEINDAEERQARQADELRQESSVEVPMIEHNPDAVCQAQVRHPPPPPPPPPQV